MRLNLLIRILVVLLVFTSAYSQEELKSSATDSISNFNFLYNKARQKSVSWSLSYQLPMTTGNNYIGQGYDGEYGFVFKTKVFVYKQLYVGYAYNHSVFDVEDTSVIGNFNSSRATAHTFNFGYEFLPLNKVKLGINYGFGSVRFRNKIGGDFEFSDTGDLQVLSFYLTYEVSKNISVFSEYGFNKVNSDISTPDSLNNFFEKGRFNTLNFGILIALGNDDVISAVKKTYGMQ